MFLNFLAKFQESFSNTLNDLIIKCYNFLNFNSKLPTSTKFKIPALYKKFLSPKKINLLINQPNINGDSLLHI